MNRTRACRTAAGGKIDAAEFLSAVGTFLAALTAFVSVGVIVLRENPHMFWTTMIMAGWVVGVTMQIIAGAIARMRADTHRPYARRRSTGRERNLKLMLGIQEFWLFIISGLLLNITPGPDTAYIIGRSVQMGWRGGAAAALGICTGCLVHVFAAALGLSALLAASSVAFTVVKWAGAAYLCFIGIQLLLSRPGAMAQPVRRRPVTRSRCVRCSGRAR